MAESFPRQLAKAFFRTSPALRPAARPVKALGSGMAQLRAAFFRTSPSLSSRPPAETGNAAAHGSAVGEYAAPGPMPAQDHADLAGLLRLPRIDRSALRTAASPGTQQLSREKEAGGVRYVLRDAGRRVLQLVAVTETDPAAEVLLPVTVFTSDRRSEYMLLFRVQRPGSWAAALDIPGFGGRADVWVHEPRSAQSLNERDVDVVRRSVRAAPDPWVGAWQSIARARVAGDPVQAAIYEALRS